MAKKGLIAALDVGTTKVCCFIAEVDDAGNARIVGIGHHASRGLKTGAIVDMELAERSILAAVNSAEQMAGTTIRDVVVSLSAGTPESRLITAEIATNGGAIGDSDIRRLMNEARIERRSPDRTPIHSIPVGYTIDGANGIRDPRNMHGQVLSASVHVVTVGTSAVQNLDSCVRNCHLEIADHVVSPYAAGLACLVEDEADLGVTVIDMGGGTTSIAVFAGGSVIYTDAIPIGGQHVTNDIARGLSTPIANAERLKTLHGSALPSPTDERELIDAPQIGEEDDGIVNRVPKSYLVSIVAPRIEETLELVRIRLEESACAKQSGRRVVLTGGASQLPGVRELAAQMLDKQVRMGRPLRIAGLAEATGGPAFATAAGLITYAVDDRSELWPEPAIKPFAAAGRLGRIGAWFRENF